MVAAKALFERAEPEPGVGAGDGLGGEGSVEAVEVESEILDPPPAELDVGEAQAVGHGRAVPAGQVQHLGVGVDADHPAGGADDLGGDEADLAPARAEVEHGLAGADERGGVAAPVVAADHLVGDRLQEPGVIDDRAAEGGLDLGGGVGVAASDGGLDVQLGARFGRAHGRSWGVGAVGPGRAGMIA